MWSYVLLPPVVVLLENASVADLELQKEEEEGIRPQGKALQKGKKNKEEVQEGKEVEERQV